MDSLDSKEQTCKNCGQGFTGQFCNHCGQKIAHRITAKHVSHDVMHVFLHADKGVFSFIQKIITSPGYLAADYINGKRKMFNPYQYFILSVGLVLFMMSKAHFYENMESINNSNASAMSKPLQNAMADFNHFIKTKGNLISYITLPISALFSWIMFLKKGNNYAEHFTLLVFSTSQVNTFTIVLMGVSIVFNLSVYQSAALTFCTGIISLTITYQQFYSLKWLAALFKGVIVFLSFYLTEMIIMGIGFFLYILLFVSFK